ncbi:hypothetical protein ACFLS1_01580 [Verrucomicrobiota bacterium]
MIESLVLNPAVKTDLTPRGKKKIEGIIFKGYEKSKFIFDDNGKEMKLSGAHITRIEVGMFARSTMTGTNTVKVVENLEEAVKPGVVTIVHFHLISDQPSPALRMENYVATLSQNEIAVIKINLNGWKDPNVEKYGIKSAPQFWFYDKQGKLSSKLIERFTAEDIDKAIKEAENSGSPSKQSKR